MKIPSASASPPLLISSRWPVLMALAMLLVAMASFLAWQYVMPADFDSSFVLNHRGVDHFRETLGIPPVSVSVAPYTVVFRTLLVTAWIAYFVMLFAVAMGGPSPRRRTLVAIVVAVGLMAALLWPPSFSCDVYGYVAYGRLQAFYGLNPYATSQKAVLKLGDPTGPFLMWNITSPYGPLWTSVSVAVVWVLRAGGLFVQVVAMKLIAAAAVVVASIAGSRIAARIDASRGDLTLVAIGLNPLFVIEGAGNAHNDFVMVALVVVALGAALATRPRLAVLVAGAAGAIKFLPLMLVPWIVLREWRTSPRGWGRFAREAPIYAIAAVLPIALAFIPYWMGPETLRGLGDRYHVGQVAMQPAVGMLGQTIALALAYVALTIWILRGEILRLPLAWMVMSGAIALFAAGIWLPWYLSWVWLPALLFWDRRSTTVSYVTFCFAFVLTMRYSIPL